MRKSVLRHADGRRLVLLGAVQGLVSEGVAAENEVRSSRPDVLALQVDPEVAPHVHEWPVVEPDSSEDETYARALRRYGEVELPPPDLRRSAAAAQELGIPVVGIDVPDMAYTDEFTRRISGMDLVRRGFRLRRGQRRLARMENPEAFADAWDARAAAGPFRQLEAWREQEMAANADTAVAAGTGIVLVEAARFGGVRAALHARGFHG